MKYTNEIKFTIDCLKPYKWFLLLTIVILITASFFEGLGVSIIIPILQSLEGKHDSNVFLSFTKNIFSVLGINHNFPNLMIIFALMMILKYAMDALQQYFSRVISASVTSTLMERAFENLMVLPISFYYNKKVGDIISTLYVSSLNAGGVIELSLQMLIGLFFLSIYVVMALLISVPLTVVAISLSILSYFFIIPKFKLGFTQGQEEKMTIDNISSFLHDKIGGIKTVKTFNNEKFHINDFNKLVSDFKRLIIKIQNNRIMASISLEPSITLLIIGLMILSVEILHMPIFYLLTFFYIFSRIIPKIKLINTNYLNIMNYLPHLLEVKKIIDRSDKLYLSEGNKEIKSLNKGISFERVYFKYPEVDEYALKNINMYIEKNKTIAIIGMSGGGKTTIVDLILRHHDSDKGIIKIDGIDLREIKRENWHKMVSMVEQDAYLFNDTIYNNIAYGNLNTNADEVIHAAKIANAHDFIQELPEKYNTIVGERGIKLSGGQKQRISLARALIRDPEILILDEATSALDRESERLIHESIEKLRTMKTIIIIAHRLSTIVNADKLFVIENGVIVKEGLPRDILGLDIDIKSMDIKERMQFESK